MRNPEHTGTSIVLVIIMTLILWGTAWPTLGQAAAGEPSRHFRKLASTDIEERQKAYKAIKEENDRFIRDLIDFAKANRPQGTKEFYSSWTLAVDLLGDLRAQEAIPYLVSEIAASPPTLILQPGMLQGHPCALALVNIGLPSIDGIMLRMVQPATRKEMVIAAYTIRAILGEKLAVSKLEEEIEKGIYRNKERVSEMVQIIRNRDYNY